MAVASGGASPRHELEAPPVVMAVDGPIVNPDGELSEAVAVCREWLLSDTKDISSLPPGEVGPELQLGTLGDIRRCPLGSLQNLHISAEDAVAELAGPLRRSCGTALVLVTTPRVYWSPADAGQRAARLRDVARQCGPAVRLVAGTAPPPGRPSGPGDVDAVAAGLVSDLACGFEGSAGAASQEPVRPGFIGEVLLSGNATCTDAGRLELDVLRACGQASASSAAAVIISGPVSEAALDALAASGCSLSRCAFFDVPPTSPVSAQQLADRGAMVGLCPPCCGADASWQDYPGRLPWVLESTFLAAFRDAPTRRTLLGANVRFRMDLRSFGGPGAAQAHELVAGAAAGGVAGLAVDCPRHGPLAGGKDSIADGNRCGHTRASLTGAAVELLKYGWRMPSQAEKVQNEIVCHWCGERRPEGEHFSKFTFDYCTPKCLRQHRDAGWDPAKRAP